MKVRIYIHDSCPISRKLLEFIKEKGVEEYLDIIDTKDHPFVSVKDGVISVPAVVVEDKLIAAGYMNWDFLGKIFETVRPENTDDEVLLKRYFRMVLDNVSTATWIYATEDHQAILENEEYVLAAAGWMNIPPSQQEYIMNRLRELLIKNTSRASEEFEKRRKKFLKVISLGFLREIYWLFGREVECQIIAHFYSREALSHWLLIRSSLGRNAMGKARITDPTIRKKTQDLMNYMKENCDELWKIVRETA